LEHVGRLFLVASHHGQLAEQVQARLKVELIERLLVGHARLPSYDITHGAGARFPFPTISPAGFGQGTEHRPGA
jgi:hypothetical protein